MRLSNTVSIFCKIQSFFFGYFLLRSRKGLCYTYKGNHKKWSMTKATTQKCPNKIDRIDLRSSNCTTTSLSHKVILWVVLQNKNDFFLLFLFSHFFTTVQYCRVVTLQKKAPHEKCKTLKLGTSLWGPPNRGCIFSLIE